MLRLHDNRHGTLLIYSLKQAPRPERGQWFVEGWKDAYCRTWEWHMIQPSSLLFLPLTFFSFILHLYLSLCLYYKLIGSQQGYLNCTFKASLCNFDNIKVAHHATCRANKEKKRVCMELYKEVTEGCSATISIPQAACVTNYVGALWQGGCWVQ